MEISNTEPEIQSNRTWYLFSLIFLFFDYVRPQAFFPAIGIIRPAFLTILLLSFIVLTKGRTFVFKSAQLKLIWLFIGILAVLVPFSTNKTRAFMTMRELMIFMPFTISILVCINSMKRLKAFIFYLNLITIYMAIYMITHKGLGPGQYFADENDVSLFIDMLLPYGYFQFVQEKIKWRKFLLGIGLFLCVGAVVISFSRGGLLGLIAAIAVIWLFSPRKIVTIIILIILGIGMLFFGEKASKLGTSRGRGDSYWSEMRTVSDTKENTAAQRIQFWGSAIRMWKDYPFGVGGTNFPVHHNDYKPESDRINRFDRLAHSLWFTLLPETGIEGVIVFFLLIFVNIKDVFFIKNNFRNRTDPNDKFLYFTSLSFLASLVGFFVAGSFISVLYYAHYWYFSGLIAATTAIARSRLAQIEEEQYELNEL